MQIKITVELVNGKVSGVYSDYNWEVGINIYKDIDISKMTDEEIDALDNEISSVPYILYRNIKKSNKGSKSGYEISLR